MSRPKILVTDSTVNVDKLKEIGEVEQYNGEGQMPRQKLLEAAKDVDGLFCLLRDKIDKEFLEKCNKLKVIGTMSVGYEHLDIEECKKRLIKVGYTPGVLTEATAELGISLLLAVSRRIVEAVDSAKSGGWTTWTPYYMCGKAIANQTIGFYGLGEIGKNMAEKLEPFKPDRIIYHNRKERKDVPSYTYVDFDTLLKESDFLICTVAATAENKGIFNTEAFKKMKNDAIFINVSRGILVKMDDLNSALETGEICAAGLDVTDPEPLPLDHPLFQRKNCTILPHIGSATVATRNLMASTTVDNIYNAFSGQKMVASVVE
ncbi:unnamed protein product [Bursaphelenchus okinawaensis]|uniref:Glyoxylate reductase/hydroxypyruvate reductase n=1 Tax=Bursaphelenchus okinawaensis TaxID=465554 RepID=A0A811KZE5_9BILA|nr:unnamed protein product [Bursaphelenchus okinawaensis]CAG9114276.1 unnamed protein product [Bursaphelenchus okinawaensis]